MPREQPSLCLGISSRIRPGAALNFRLSSVMLGLLALLSLQEPPPPQMGTAEVRGKSPLVHAPIELNVQASVYSGTYVIVYMHQQEFRTYRYPH